MPGGGAAYVHLSEMIPFIKSSIEDLDEHIGADIVAKVQCSLSLSLFGLLLSKCRWENLSSFLNSCILFCVSVETESYPKVQSYVSKSLN